MGTTTKTALVVLGMHRSGTSSVAGVLGLLGATPPKTLLEPAPDNPKGFWESRAIIHFNDRILQAGESWWNDWRDFDMRKLSPTQRREFEDEIPDLLISEFGNAEEIILKDPRLCRLWPIWEPAVKRAGYAAKYLLPIRSPLETARSLTARNGFSTAEGLVLWLQHVFHAERQTRGRPRRVLLWADFMRDWRAEIALAEPALSWRPKVLDAPTEAAVDAFLAPDLHRQRSTSSELAGDQSHAWAADGYTLMAELAREDSPAVHRRLDALRRRFETACDLFGAALGPVLWNAHSAPIYLGERDQALREVVDAREALAESMRVQALTMEALSASEGRVATLVQQADSARIELEEAGLQARRLVETVDRLTTILADMDARHAALSDAHGRLEQERAAERQESLRDAACLKGQVEELNTAREQDRLDRQAEQQAAATALSQAVEETRQASDRLTRLTEDLARRPFSTVLSIRRASSHQRS